MADTSISEAVLFILTSLADQPRHGYAIMKDVAQLSDGRVQLSTGTLYGALQRLLKERWIERVAERETLRGRQSYRLSPNGRRVLDAEIARIKQLARVASLRLSQEA
jgi:DNA-binding PadR family transcriptional regulator